MNTIRSFGTGFLLLFCSTTISAQSEDPLLLLSLEDLLDVTVTIANRVEEKFINAPSSVTVITGQEIKNLGVKTLVELLNYVPGFQNYMSTQDSNGGLVLARGLPDIYARHVLLLIDGHRINDEYTGGFTFADQLLGLYNVKQVEFIRGPGSTLYGSNAFSGVINIITDKSNEVIATSGGQNAEGVSASAMSKLNNGISSAVSFQYFRDDGQEFTGLTDSFGFNKSARDPRNVFEGRIELGLKQHRVTIEYSKTELQDLYIARRINNGVNERITGRVGTYYEYDFDLTKGWKATGRIGSVRHMRIQQFVISPTNPVVRTSEWRQDTNDVQLDASVMSASGHQISLGGYFGISDIPIAKSNVIDRFVFDETRRTTGIYMQDQFWLGSHFRFTGGLRYDHYSDVGSSVNPRLAILYQWQEHQSFKFMYGRAYRAPSLGDLYDKEGIGTLSLDPVTVDSLEVAYLYTLLNNSITLTWFYNDYRDFITTRKLGSGLVIFDNVYDSKIQGLELETIWKYNNEWGVRAGLTWVFSSKTEKPIDQSFSTPGEISPSVYGNFQLNYRKKRWNGNVSMVAHNGVDVLQDKNSLLVMNSNVIYLLAKKWEVGFNIRNLTDKEYGTPQNRSIGQNQFSQDIQEMPAREREVFLSFKYLFND